MGLRGYYIGADDALKGEHALLQVKGARVEAQFDSHRAGLGYGWHPYPPEDFFIYRVRTVDQLDNLPFETWDIRVRRKYTNGLSLEYDLRRPAFNG
jgi:hypothetical protein